MIKINLKESITNLIQHIEELEYEEIVNAVNNPDCHDPSFYDDLPFTDIVIFRKELLNFGNMYLTNEFIELRENLLKILNQLIIERANQ